MKTVEQIVSEVWPGWELESLIGVGAYGEVYKAFRDDIAGRSSAAIKVMKVYRLGLQLQGAEKSAADEEMNRLMERFSREIRLMQSLKGQTNLVSIDDYQVTEDQEEGILYILIRMELLTPLMQDLEIRGTTEERIIRLGTDLCRGLEVCENEHIVHRDIKPENIFVNRRGDFKLGDFSVARTMSITRESFTARDDARLEKFAAPELKTGFLRKASYEEACRADIYSLGMVLYWAANGMKQPFLPEKQLYTNSDREEAEFKRLQGEPLPGIPGISPALQDVILKACAFEPEKRFANVQEFRKALERIGQEGSETDDALPIKPKKRKLPWLIAAIAVLTAFLLIWLLLPVQVPVRYVGPDSQVLYSGTIAVRPGMKAELIPSADHLPEGYVVSENEPRKVNADFFRRTDPREIQLRCEKKQALPLPDTLKFSDISFPNLYSIGQPFEFEGCVESDAELKKITINLYAADQSYTREIEPDPGTTRYEMKEAGDQVFYSLDEGTYWFELIAADTAGRMLGYSHKCSASYLAEDHTLYYINRSSGAIELRGEFVYNGHTYEIYRIPGGGWNISNSFAQGKGGHLVTFADEDEFSVIASFCLGMGIKYLYTGARYENGAWSWVDGSDFGYRIWPPGVEDQPGPVYHPVGSMVYYTSTQQWYYGQATEYEIGHFIVEYEDYIH